MVKNSGREEGEKICEETEGAPELGTRINSPDDVTTSPVKSPTRAEKTPSPRPAKTRHNNKSNKMADTERVGLSDSCSYMVYNFLTM